MPETDPPSSTLQRVAVRTRESQVTLSGWRLAVPVGPGAITLVESATGSWFRGEGAYFGWPQERLAAEYGRLLPKGEDPAPDPGQFG